MAGPKDILPYQAPVSEFTTPGDQQRQRISTGFGWDIGHPGQEFLRRLFTQLPLAIPHPATAWAARTPSAITGGLPEPRLYVRDPVSGKIRETASPEFLNSSAGIDRSYRLQRELGTRTPADGYRTHDNRNSPPTNLRTPNERGWWLRGPGGGD